MTPLCLSFLPLVPGRCAMWSESRCLSSADILQILINNGTAGLEFLLRFSMESNKSSFPDNFFENLLSAHRGPVHHLSIVEQLVSGIEPEKVHSACNPNSAGILRVIF